MGKMGKKDKNFYKSLMMFSQFGINMLVPIGLCTAAGIWLDEKCNTSFWVVVLFFMGAMAGFQNIFKMAKTLFPSKDEIGPLLRGETEDDNDRENKEHK